MTPDISMCKEEKCPLKEKCYRYTAKPDEYQSYLVDKKDIGKNCDLFWEVKDVPNMAQG